MLMKINPSGFYQIPAGQIYEITQNSTSRFAPQTDDICIKYD